MTNRCIIIGSGASIRQDMWDISAKELPIWSLIKDEFTIGINWSKNFFDSTILLYIDYNFYLQEKSSIEKLPLVISSQDAFYGKELKKDWKKIFQYGNISLLPSNRKYQGLNSWKEGFYTRKLSGIYAITLAICLGVQEIFLLGMDCCATNGKTHFYQDEPNVGVKTVNIIKETGVGIDSKGRYKTSLYNNKNINENYECFKNLPVKIYNVSPESKINVFLKIDYKEFEKILKTDPIKINQEEKRKEFIFLHKKHYE
jgi:hypothetical protein